MERVFECVLLTLFHFPPPNIYKYWQIFSDVCKYLQIFFTTRYFPPRSLWYPASFYSAVHKNYFRTSFETPVRMLDTHANVVAFWVVQPARQQLLTIKIFPESLTVRPLIEFFFWNKYFNDYIFSMLLQCWCQQLLRLDWVLVHSSNSAMEHLPRLPWVKNVAPFLSQAHSSLL